MIRERANALLFGAALLFVLLHPATTVAQLADPEFKPLTLEQRMRAEYSPYLVEVKFHYPKKEYMIGEPIYWEVEFKNTHGPITEIQFQPNYELGVYLEIMTPESTPFRYQGTDISGFQNTEAHKILPGESRFCHFRVYFDDDPVTPHDSKLLFYEPTRALLKPAIRYIANSTNQIYSPDEVFPLEISEPVGRNAECLRLLKGKDLIATIHDMRAEPEEFELIENILHLYSDTVYAPHLAIALANGYYWKGLGKDGDTDPEYLRQAIAAYTVLLQVEDVPYIQELSLFMIAAAYYQLGQDASFLAWYQKYVDTYGERARFDFTGSKFQMAFEEKRDKSQGPFWYLFK